MTNEQLAHELFLDPAFELDESGGCRGENPVHSKIRSSFHVNPKPESIALKPNHNLSHTIQLLGFF
jgi:hypothetical protein